MKQEVWRVFHVAQVEGAQILGQGKAAAGDGAGAKTLWQDASARLPANAPLKAEIARRIAALK